MKVYVRYVRYTEMKTEKIDGRVLVISLVSLKMICTTLHCIASRTTSPCCLACRLTSGVASSALVKSLFDCLKDKHIVSFLSAVIALETSSFSISLLKPQGSILYDIYSNCLSKSFRAVHTYRS